MKELRYFIAVLGSPEPPDRDIVESGIYHPDPRYAPFSPEIGDVLLFYCTGSYDEHSMKVPGIGIVLEVDNNEIRYRYIPFIKKIYRDELIKSLNEEENKKFKNIRFSSHWVFEISKDSFVNCSGNSLFNWP